MMPVMGRVFLGTACSKSHTAALLQQDSTGKAARLKELIVRKDGPKAK
jgi:hypothetical protein